MGNSVYVINKGINKSIEFKGLKAQYIWYLGAGAMILMILYAILYLAGIDTYVGMALILSVGAGMVMKVYQMSNKYGEYGLMKEIAKRGIPKVVKCNSREVFRNMNITAKRRSVIKK
ncbi:DUF4133 domain-containing protein [Chitinophaga sp. MM2321]|uniref:DUF4133 domain-containing protein n=1 Tax=Chitinophaga sp. MM2321 TaxID=3137178 RepID=UPI0032D5AFEE